MRFEMLLLAAVVSPLAGCAFTHESRVPGIEGNGYELTEVDEVPPLADVITAVKVQLGRAYGKLPAQFKDPKFAPKTGSGTFQGMTQLVETDSGNLLAVFPFTGYAGSTLTPNLGVSAQATSTQTTTLTFSFQSSLEAEKVPEGADAGNALEKTLVAAFNELEKTLQSDVGGPKFTNRELKLNLSFVVRTTSEGGLGFTLVPSGPDADAVTGAPAFGTSAQRAGTYAVELTIPLITPEAADTKRILHGRYEENGDVYLIDRPFTVDAHRKYSRGAESNRPAGADSNSLEGLVEEEPEY